MSDEKTSDMTTTKPPQPPPQPQQQQQPQPQPAASATETASEEGVPPDAVGAVIWSWEDDSNSWEPFSPMLQSQLEAAHAGSKHAVPVDGQRCVDVGAMMQIHTNGRRRPVRRVVAATIAMMPVTVATYNIAGGHSTFSHDDVLSALQSLNADVICLQEVLGDDMLHTQAHRLADDLRMSCVFGQAHQTRVFGNAILSRLPLTRRHDIELPRGSLKRDDGSRMPGQNERRAALAVIVSPFREVPVYDFVCVCTHVGKYNSAEQSTKALVPGKSIGQFVNTEALKDPPALLVGDFNCRWAEPFAGVVSRIDTNWNIYPSTGTKTAKDDDPEHKIDYICDRGRSRWRVQGGLTHAVRNDKTDFGDGHKPSDHLPLVAVWEPLPLSG
jgi:endonuclease/exonuclease/phosphatase family metal-dependent hydrolase